MPTQRKRQRLLPRTSRACSMCTWGSSGKSASCVPNPTHCVRHMHICALPPHASLQFFGLPISFLSGFQRASLLIRAGTAPIMMQLLARIWLTSVEDQMKAANLCSALAYATTTMQWAVVIYCDQVHGYAVISDTPLVLLLFVMQIILQGTFFGSVGTYRLSCIPVPYFFFTPIVSAHLYLHEPPPGRQLLLTKGEFLGVFLFVTTICIVISTVNVHTRRIHLAELAGLAEHYQRQRDRLQFDSVYRSTRQRGGARSPRSNRGGSTRGAESDKAGATPLYEGASTYGSNSELAYSEYDDDPTDSQSSAPTPQVVDGKSVVFNTLNDTVSSKLGSISSMASEKVREREAVLWSTLDSLGITPKEHAHTD